MHKAADVCGACAPNVQGMLPENQSSLPERGPLTALEPQKPEDTPREHFISLSSDRETMPALHSKVSIS